MPRGFYARTGIEFDTSSLIKGLENVAERVVSASVDAVLNAGEIIRSRAYYLANVSPGIKGNARDGRHMRDCIEVNLFAGTSYVGVRIEIDMTNVYYAAHQEFGARGKPFIRPALDESREEVHEMLRATLQEGIEG